MEAIGRRQAIGALLGALLGLLAFLTGKGDPGFRYTSRREENCEEYLARVRRLEALLRR